MAPSGQDNVFITYNNPTELKSKQNRRTVSSFASKSYRPTSRRIVLDRTHYRPFVRRQDGEPASASGVNSKKQKGAPDGKKGSTSNDPERVLTPQEFDPRNECALGSPLADPFTTYPIAYKAYVPFLVDYFIRFLTPRFSPALGVETSRYLIWFNVAMHNSELFHALIALSQVYYNIDIKGFGNTHWTALYHRGEALKQLRLKVEAAKNADDDAAILTALWLMDVDVAHDDLHAYAMHKRAKERMVATRGGIRRLNADLQDELLKSEFFLPLLLHGNFVVELTKNDVLVRFKENNPVKTKEVAGFQGPFPVIANNGLITSQAVEILWRIFHQVSREPRFVRTGGIDPVGGDEQQRTTLLDLEYNEMSRVLRITDEVGPISFHHRLLLALLVYIFNFHNQPQLLPRSKSSSSSSASSPSSSNTARPLHPYLEILCKVALELSQPSNPGDATSVTEREVTLWTMVAIGSASSFSPWRLEIPFMGHLIEWMEDDENGDEDDEEGRDKEKEEEQQQTSNSTPGTTISKEPTKNLEKLTACLRGYYLYGADKTTLRGLQKWNRRSEPKDPL